MIVKNTGYNTVEVRWRQDRRVKTRRLYRRIHGGHRVLLIETAANRFKDTVPVALSRQTYTYELDRRAADKTLPAEYAETSKTDWCEDLLPGPHIPGHADWAVIYRKAWDLTWRRIVTSDRLPHPHAYCDYPDGKTVYVWDSCFCSLFQRYAAVRQLHPCPSNLDNFYAIQQASGYIYRRFHYDTFEFPDGLGKLRKRSPAPDGVNPPLFSWAEWNYYLIAADKERLRRVLPKLVRYHEFIETFLREKPGCYRWHAHGAGWDNINDNQDENEICYFVDLAAQQAFSAYWIACIAGETGQTDCRNRYHRFWTEQKKLINRIYWNKAANWYCSLTRKGTFTRKTLNGMWPLLAGIADRDKAQRAVKKTLMNPACFLTEPMPLPVLARDEPGYNPLGEYWLGGVWLNMSLVTIQALKLYGFRNEASTLASRTLNGIARVYNEYGDFPHSLWECYAPETVRPALLKTPDGMQDVVREEFGGWTCCLINILIEDILGFHVDAPRNTLTWKINLPSEHGIERLCFGETQVHARIQTTRTKRVIEAESNRAFKLHVVTGGKAARISVKPGRNTYFLQK